MHLSVECLLGAFMFSSGYFSYPMRTTQYTLDHFFVLIGLNYNFPSKNTTCHNALPVATRTPATTRWHFHHALDLHRLLIAFPSIIRHPCHHSMTFLPCTGFTPPSDSISVNHPAPLPPLDDISTMAMHLHFGYRILQSCRLKHTLSALQHLNKAFLKSVLR